MINAMVMFQKIDCRWKVYAVSDCKFTLFHRSVKVIPMGYPTLVVTGNFHEKPKVGTYCKRPHKLMKWD